MKCIATATDFESSKFRHGWLVELVLNADQKDTDNSGAEMFKWNSILDRIREAKQKHDRNGLADVS